VRRSAKILKGPKRWCAYTIVNMGVWGWARMVPFILVEDAWADLPHLKRLHDEIAARPAAARAVGLKDRFPFKTEMDEDARAHMFKHLAPANAA
jgi:GST-like protein